MNPEYQKGKYRKVTTRKKKDPANKIAPSKKTSATKTESNAETENKKRPSLEINYNVLDKLFDPVSFPLFPICKLSFMQEYKVSEISAFW
jgi:hypothetical protein